MATYICTDIMPVQFSILRRERTCSVCARYHGDQSHLFLVWDLTSHTLNDLCSEHGHHKGVFGIWSDQGKSMSVKSPGRVQIFTIPGFTQVCITIPHGYVVYSEGCRQSLREERHTPPFKPEVVHIECDQENNLALKWVPNSLWIK